MRIHFAARFFGTYGLVLATIAAVGFLATRDDGYRMLSTDPFVRKLPSIRYELRAEQTGELYRGHKLDEDGLVRQVRVQFRDGTYGLKFTNGGGILVGLKEVLKDGTYIVYDLEPDSKTSRRQRMFSRDDVLLRERQEGEAGVKVTLFGADGKTPAIVEEIGKDTVLKTFWTAAGKLRARFKQTSAGALDFEVFNADGSLRYTESATAPQPCEMSGNGQDVLVSVYRDDGTLSFRQFYTAAPSAQKPELWRVEEYAADGKRHLRQLDWSEKEVGTVKVTTFRMDGSHTWEKLNVGQISVHLVTEPVHPAKDLESKLSETLDFPLHLNSLVN